MTAWTREHPNPFRDLGVIDASCLTGVPAAGTWYVPPRAALHPCYLAGRFTGAAALRLTLTDGVWRAAIAPLPDAP